MMRSYCTTINAAFRGKKGFHFLPYEPLATVYIRTTAPFDGGTKKDEVEKVGCEGRKEGRKGGLLKY